MWYKRKTMKEMAKLKLAPRVWASFAACALPMLIMLTLSFLPDDLWRVRFYNELYFYIDFSAFSALMIMLAYLFVVDPMQAGQAEYFVRLVSAQEEAQVPHPLIVCDCFTKRYGKTLLGMLCRRGILLLAPVLLGLAALPSLRMISSSNESLIAILFYQQGTLMLLSAIPLAALAVYLQAALWMVPYILALEPGVGAYEAVAKSFRMTKGHIWELFVAEASFWGWQLLGALTFGLTNIYAAPYIQAVKALYYVDLLQAEVQREAFQNNEDEA